MAAVCKSDWMQCLLGSQVLIFRREIKQVRDSVNGEEIKKA